MALDTPIEDMVPKDSSGYAMNGVVMTDGCNGAADTHPNGDDTKADHVPHVNSHRTHSQSDSHTQEDATFEGPSAGSTLLDGVITQATLEQLAQLSDKQWFERAMKQCTSNPVRPVASGNPGTLVETRSGVRDQLRLTDAH